MRLSVPCGLCVALEFTTLNRKYFTVQSYRHYSATYPLGFSRHDHKLHFNTFQAPKRVLVSSEGVCYYFRIS